MKISITKSIDTNSLTEEFLYSMSKDDLVQIVLQLKPAKPIPSNMMKKNPNSIVYGCKRKDTSSEFSYISWRKDKKDWMVQIMGKIIGYFDDEIVAALAADSHLDSISDIKRPRNRNKMSKKLV